MPPPPPQPHASAGPWVQDQRTRSPLAGPSAFPVSSRLPQVTHRNVATASSSALAPSHSHSGLMSPAAPAAPLVSRSPSTGSPCFVHSHLDNSLTDFISKKDAQAAARRKKDRGKGREPVPAKGHNGAGAADLEEGDSDTASEGEAKDSNDEGVQIDDDDEEGPSLTRQLAETAVSVREMSKQLGRARVVSAIQSVMIITKARDNHLIRLTRELALWLMQTPRNGRDRGLVVYVDTQLRKSKRFDAEGMQRDHPELFRPLPRRYSRTSSSTSLSNNVLDPAAKRMAPLSQLNDALKRSASPEFVRKHPHDGDDEGQLRYWTNDMCTEKPHLFDFVVTLGGDGTVLYASWLFQHIVPPVIPFALGSLGFLTGFDFPKYAQVLNSAIDNGIRVNLRMRFTCTVYRAIEGEENKKRRAMRSGKTGGIFMSSLTKDGWEAIESGGGAPPAEARENTGKKDREIKCFSTRAVESFEVLNDLVVDRGPSPYVSLLELFGDEHHMTTVQADGLTVSTPTGSTAYSLSAGGSLVHPEVPALLITPICPHTLSFRPMLLPDSMELRICVPYNSRSTAWASFDGRGRVELRQGDHIKVTASQYPFPTVCADNQSTDWFQAIARTLKWNERQRQKSFVILEEGRKKPKGHGEKIVHDNAATSLPPASSMAATPADVAAKAKEDFGDEEDEEEEDEEEDEESDGDETYDIDDLSGGDHTTTSSPVSGPKDPHDPVLNGDVPMLVSRSSSHSSGEREDSHRHQSSTASSIDLHDPAEDRFQQTPPRPPRLSSRHSVIEVPQTPMQTGTSSDQTPKATPPMPSRHRMSSSTTRRRERGEEGDRDHIHEPLNVKRNVGGSSRNSNDRSPSRGHAHRSPRLVETSGEGDMSDGRAFAVVGADSDTDVSLASKDAPLFSEKPLPPRSSANEGSRRAKNDDVAMQGDPADRPLWMRLPAWVPIICWISTSSFVILQNKHILTNLGFSHPIALTTIHLLFQTVMTRILRRYTTLIDGAKELEATGKMTREVFIRKIVPIGILFSASLVLSNWVYLVLSVSFIQMIKAFTPVSVLLISFALKLKEPSQKLFAIVCLISVGVAIASYGEVEFHLVGFLVQALAIAIESCRLVLIQILLQGIGMNPLTSLYYTAPVCLCVNAVILLPVEGFQPFHDAVHLVGIPTLLGNASMTFALNLSSVWLIGKASGLVLTLAGVVKDILLIAGSWAILGSTITGTQIFGYAIALTGLVIFKTQVSSFVAPDAIIFNDVTFDASSLNFASSPEYSEDPAVNYFKFNSKDSHSIGEQLSVAHEKIDKLSLQQGSGMRNQGHWVEFKPEGDVEWTGGVVRATGVDGRRITLTHYLGSEAKGSVKLHQH